MSTLPHIEQAVQNILTTRAKELERETGFVQRSTAQLDGPAFAQTVVFGWMSLPEASYSQLRHVAASLGVQVSTQAVEQRFGKGSAELLKRLLAETVNVVITHEGQTQELLSRFNGIYLQDGTVISLPESLAEVWKGCGGNREQAGASSLRVQARLDLARGGLQGPWLQDGRACERSGEAMSTPLPTGALWDVDMGYFTLHEMRKLEQEGDFWVTHAKATLTIIDKHGQVWELLSFLEAHAGKEIDEEVFVGKRERLPVRLLAVRISQQEAQRRRQRAKQQAKSQHKGCQLKGRRSKGGTGQQRQPVQRKRRKVSPARMRLAGWTILLTNVPAPMLTLQEALVLVRCRWQIELLWKLWKQQGKVDTWRSEKSERILTEIYAKLIGLVIQHWLTIVGCWQAPNRSLVKAAQVVQWMTPGLVLAFAGLLPVQVVLQRTTDIMASGCRIDTRRRKPNTYQLINQPKLNSS
jgi:Transposase DDE domain